MPLKTKSCRSRPVYFVLLVNLINAKSHDIPPVCTDGRAASTLAYKDAKAHKDLLSGYASLLARGSIKEDASQAAAIEKLAVIQERILTERQEEYFKPKVKPVEEEANTTPIGQEKTKDKADEESKDYLDIEEKLYQSVTHQVQPELQPE
eukprot:5527324-Pyramimonas_sp.AAC.1